MRETTPEEVLGLPLRQPNDADAATVRDYLLALLLGVWGEQEGFDGKRPFGNSGWDHDLMEPLAVAGIIDAEIDPEEGWVNRITWEERDRGSDLITEAIRALAAPKRSEMYSCKDCGAVMIRFDPPIQIEVEDAIEGDDL